MAAIIKGGEGSGIRGHVTIRDRVDRLTPSKRTELLGKLKGELDKRTAGKPQKAAVNSSTGKRLSKIDQEVEDYFKKLEKDKAEREKANPIAMVDRIKNQETIQDGKQWVKSLDKNERGAVEEYRVSWDEMRDADRKGTQDKETDAKLNALYNAITKAPEVSSPIYRGLTIRNDTDFANLKVGKTFTNAAISSFTTDKKVAELFAGMNANSNKKPFVLLECTNPKRAYSIASLPSASGANKKDQEALVPKGVKYKIVAVEKMSLKYANMKIGQGDSYSGIKIRVEEIH